MKPTYNGYQLKVMRDPHPTNPLDMWDAWSGNPMDNIKDFVSEYRAYIDGDVWGYTLTPALYDNDNELVEVDPDPEEQDSCFGFYGTQANCITHALPAFAADSLIAHCGEWLEECTINIFEVPDGTGV